MAFRVGRGLFIDPGLRRDGEPFGCFSTETGRNGFSPPSAPRVFAASCRNDRNGFRITNTMNPTAFGLCGEQAGVGSEV
jgi:hypothetical protein